MYSLATLGLFLMMKFKFWLLFGVGSLKTYLSPAKNFLKTFLRNVNEKFDTDVWAKQVHDDSSVPLNFIAL